MNHFCMRCSVFENDEDVAGWKAGSSVAYCATCFEEKMTKEMNHKDVGHEEDFQTADQRKGNSRGRSVRKTGLSEKVCF